MTDKTVMVSARSSYFVSKTFILIVFVLILVAAFLSAYFISGVLLLVLLFGVFERCWAFLSAKNMNVKVSLNTFGLFAGDDLKVKLIVSNNKVVGVPWLELIFPLSKNLCLVPENVRTPEEGEKMVHETKGWSTELIGELKEKGFKGNEHREIVTNWHASRRGVYSIEGFKLRTGDGMGFATTQRNADFENDTSIAVYPSLVNVKTGIFMRNMWNADTGSNGIMDDITVIRSTRDYRAGDPFKSINWRLTAKGMPLTVNVYEEILPRCVCFILDGQSFAKRADEAKLEDALSVLGSVVVKLIESGMHIALIMSENDSSVKGHVSFLGYDAAEDEYLWALAEFMPEFLNAELENVTTAKPDPSVFPEEELNMIDSVTGRYFFFTKDLAGVSGDSLLYRLPSELVTVISSVECNGAYEFEVYSLESVKEGKNE